jgi:hypothetical protein
MSEAQVIEGMEDIKETGPTIPFIRIVSSKMSLKGLGEAGSVVNTATKEVLAKKGESFKFIPIKMFRRWTLWSADNKLIKFMFDGDKCWSDGSAIEHNEVNWHDDTEKKKRVSPLATFSTDIIVVPLSKIDTKEYALLSFMHTNKDRVKFANKVVSFIKTETICNGKPGIRFIAYELDVTMVETDQNIWFDFSAIRVNSVLDSDKLLDVHNEVKDFNKSTKQLVLAEANNIVEPTVIEPALSGEKDEF